MDAENRTPPTFRAAGLTLVALVAMSATVAAGPAPRAADEGRLEGHVVRAVAAAVVAAARDLLVPEHTAASVAVVELCFVTDDAGVGRIAFSRDAASAWPRLLGARLLDLPPPAC